MKSRIIIFLSFLFISVCSFAQAITGTVINADSGKPIANASVYLNGTSKGTSSNSEGKFTLVTNEKNIPLIISCVGYQSQTIDNYTGGNLNIALKIKSMSLPEVVIGGMSREDQLKIFLTQFIGSTNQDCTISNTSDINFTYHKKVKALNAEASEPLIIYNKKLGYKITYFLTYFKYSPEEIHYEGNYFFAEDTAGLEPKALKKIRRARDEAYLGSRMHFIRSLWENALEKNRYYVAEKLYDDIIKVDSAGQKFITLKQQVPINYNNTNSWISLNPDKNQAIIEKNGYYDPSIIWSGVMANQRINVMLPFEFVPSGPGAFYQEQSQPQVVNNVVLMQIIALQNAISKDIKPVEKLYIQTDKTYYTTGDTLRFKGYLLNANDLTASGRSGLLYVELDGTDSKAAKRIMVPIENGLTWGDIILDSKDISEGNYTLRAYTNWQRNFGEDYIFKKEISIAATKGESLLVKAGFTQKEGKVEGIMQFTSLDGHIQALKDIQLKVMNGRKNLSKDKLMTGTDGTVKVNFAIPEGASSNNLSIRAQDVSKGISNGQELSIPVTINRPENTDVQFMPEGGKLVAGIQARVGIKAISEDGKGATITGKILNSSQQEVVAIKTTHAGMGSFAFTPQAGEKYTARIDGISKDYNLPVVNATGTALSVVQTADSLSIILTTIPTTTTLTTTLTNTNYYLLGQSRGVVCYARVISFDKGHTVKVLAGKDQFPTGIARFTLINSNHQPLNERQVFINHHDNLDISIETDKANYATRDSVGLTITARDKDGKPVQGSFSLAVTDNSQVKTDSLQNNILSNLLLTSDLKGNIEEPNYYFIKPEKKEQELDNLLLTQGWVSYDWQEVFYPNNKPIAYKPEKEFTVNGKVTTALGKPIEKSEVILVANHPLLFLDTLTNKDGRFTFKNLFPVDTAIFKIQARNRNGREMNVKIEMDKAQYPEFKPFQINTPWYSNIDSTMFKNTQTKAVQLQAIANYNGEERMLKEVVINEKKIIKGSKNLNGPGEADQIIDEEELKKADKMTLEELLQRKIKGFTLGGFTPPNREYPKSLDRPDIIRDDYPWIHRDSSGDKLVKEIEAIADAGKQKPWRYGYMINNQEVHFIIDGMDLDFFYDDSGEVFSFPFTFMVNDTKRYTYIKRFLDYFTAEDITGIELMSQPKYSSNYNTAFEKNRERSTNGRYNTFAYLEITTRSKAGPFMEIAPGTYLYKTLPFTLAKQFYSPKYTAINKTVAIGTDLRSTLYWEPDIITDVNGKANLSFFTADKKSGFTILLEGINNQGDLGYKLKHVN